MSASIDLLVEKGFKTFPHPHKTRWQPSTAQNHWSELAVSTAFQLPPPNEPRETAEVRRKQIGSSLNSNPGGPRSFISKVLKEKSFGPSVFYPDKFSFKWEGVCISSLFPP